MVLSTEVPTAPQGASSPVSSSPPRLQILSEGPAPAAPGRPVTRVVPPAAKQPAAAKSAKSAKPRAKTPRPASRGKGRAGSPVASNSMRSTSAGKSTAPSLSVMRRASPGARRKMIRRATQAFITDEEAARAGISQERDVEFSAVMQEISDLSFEPHRRVILLLQHELHRVKEEYSLRTTRTENAAAKLIDEAARMVSAVHDTGEQILNDSAMLDEAVAFTRDEMVVNGKVHDCAQNPSSRLTDAHLPVCGWNSTEKPGIKRIRMQFVDFCKPLDDGEASDLSIVSRVDDVCNATHDMTEAFVCLLNHSHRQLQRARAMINEQQRALDDVTTRLKVADDILEGTINKHHVEVDSAMRLCREFGMELRQRMDIIEKETRDTLSELIDRSTEVSIANNAFHDHAQLLVNKENALQWYMSKMETIVVEQGKVLLDARLRLLQLWKERSGDGDEARATLTHSGLPNSYHPLLESCDRDTLVRLLHYVTLNNADATGLLISALDEHEHFLSTNTAEANAVVERGAMEQAVIALLQKLSEEGEIKLNPRGCANLSLSDAIFEMVRRYDVHITAMERRARRAARRAGPPPLPFFDPRTPVPAEFAADIAARAKPPLPGLAVPRILSELRRSCPAALDPPGTATVVGFGRWGGQCAQQQPREETAVEKQQTTKTTKTRMATMATMPAPPPRAPPRVDIMRHVLGAHTHPRDKVLGSTREHLRCHTGEDAPFLKMQRELIERTVE